MKRFLAPVVGVLIVVVVIAFFARNFVARKSVEVGVERVTGFPMEIGSVDVALFKSQIDARNIRLSNPTEFKEKTFVEMPQLYIDYRLGSMLARAPHINDMLVDIDRLVIVENEKGENNAMKLKGVLSSGEGNTKYRIDQLRIRVGTVTTVNRAGKSRTIPLNVKATYHNITDTTDISRLVLLTVASQVSVPGIKVDDLKKGLEGVTGAAGEVLKGATEAGKGLFDAIQKAVPQKSDGE
jgi:uncharacterized protein involved in outer membrane biogenesis